MDNVNYLCVNSYTGEKVDYDLSTRDSFNENKILCESKGGYLIHNNEWIDPDKKQFCRKDKYINLYSTRICDETPDTKFIMPIEQKPATPYVKEIDPDIRRNSRLRILVIGYTLILVILIFWLLLGNFYSTNYIVIVVIIILLLTILGYLFCPFSICYLEPDSDKWRTNFMSWLYTKFN